MAVLSTAQRKKLPSKSFALPGKGEGPHGKGAGSYPIPDASHARNALARVAQHGSSAEKAKVRAKVHAKYPGIGKRQYGGPLPPPVDWEAVQRARGYPEGAYLGSMGGGIGRAPRRESPDEQGRSGEKSEYEKRYGEGAYAGYAKGGPVESAGHHEKEERLLGRLAKHAEHAPPHRGHAQEKRDVRELRKMEEAEEAEYRQMGGPVTPASWSAMGHMMRRAKGGKVAPPAIGDRKLREGPPKYPRIAGDYV
jgi:hypothetical protein